MESDAALSAFRIARSKNPLTSRSAIHQIQPRISNFHHLKASLSPSTFKKPLPKTASAMKPKFRSFPVILSLVTVAISPQLQAANDSWKDDTDGFWDDSTYWTGGNAPGTIGGTTSTDVATFGVTLTQNRVVYAEFDRNIGGLTFSNTSAFGYIIADGSLKLSNGGIIQLTGNTGSHTDQVDSSIEIQGEAGAATFTSSSTLANRLLKIGSVSGVSTGANVTTLTLNGTQAPSGVLENAVQGMVTDGSGGGRLAVVKDGTGAWTLSNASNDFTGGTEVKAGIMRVTHGQALGLGDLKLAGGQTHLINNTNTTYPNNVVVTANATVTPTRASGSAGTVIHTLGTLSIGANTLTSTKFSATTGSTVVFGDTTLSGAPVFAPGAGTTVQLGSASGAFGITQNGAGTTTLAGTNTFTSATVTTGILQVGAGGTAGDLGSGAVTLAANTVLGFSRSSAATFSNAISGGGIIRSNNANNVISLTNDSHTGSTQILNGVLATNSNAPIVVGTTNAATLYGVVGLNSDFTKSLGTGVGNIAWNTGLSVSGGFAVMDAATRVVNIGNSPTPDTLAVGVTPNFAAGTNGSTNSRLKFGDVLGLALGTVEFRNPLDLGGGDRSLVVVVDGQAAVAANLTGNITGSGLAVGTGNALVKFGQGNLKLSGTNSYTGRTIVGGLEGAVILGSAGAFSPNAWMYLDGGATGVLGGLLGLGHADLSANLGQVAGGVHFQTSGGFAAYGADRSVTLNGGSTLVWASTPGFLGNTNNLVLSQSKATGKIRFTNGIDFNGALRTIQVNDGSTAQDAEISGPLVGAGGFTKSGAGHLVLSGAGTYTGNTVVSAGSLTLASGGQLSFALAESGVNNSIAGAGTATFDGTFNIDLTNPLSAVEGNSWTLVDKTTLTATFGSTFSITGFTKAGGVHTKVTGGGTWTFTEADGKLAYTASGGGSAFETWINGYSAQLPSPADRLPGADPDRDGASNILEFALKGVPHDGSKNGLLAVNQADTDADSSKEVTLTIAVRSGASFTGSPSPAATVDGVTYQIQGSLDLGNFTAPVTRAATALAPAVTGLPVITGSGWEYQTFTLTASEGLPNKGFLRAKVSE